jgi:hypothetical protein
MELMKQVFSKENMYAAYKAVWQNQGSAAGSGNCRTSDGVPAP